MDNEVLIVGKLTDSPVYSHEYQGINYYVSTVKTNYLRKKIYKESYIRVYIPESIIISPTAILDSNVEIEGQLINSMHDGHKDVSIVVHSLTPTDKDFFNYAKLSGVISRVFTNEGNFVNFVNFLVSTSNSEHKRTVSLRVVAWSKLAHYIFNNLGIGDKVVVIGSLSSSVYDPSKERSGIDISDKVFISELYCTTCSKLDR